ncbi:MAG: L,D-transpeptidase family protein [Prosthecobacter sp.]
MKSRWFSMVSACVLPPVVGVGVCGGMIHFLKDHELFRMTPAMKLVAGKDRAGRGSGTSAEIRAALPHGATFDPDMSARMPTHADREAVRRAAEAAQRRAAPAPKQAPVATEPAIVKAVPAPALLLAPRKQTPVLFRPGVSRPAPDRNEDHWTRLLPRASVFPPAYKAVINDNPGHLARLVAQGISPEEATPGGDTPLCVAVRMGHFECVRVLALAGVDLNRPGYEKQPPIAIAVLRRNTEVLQELLAAGVDPNTRFKTPVLKEVIERCTIKDLRNALESDRGITPLICCAARGDVEGAVTLLRGGAKPGLCTTRYHRYPINFAATQGYLFLMRVLLGRDPDSEPNLLVTVNLTNQRAWVTKEGRVVNSTSVSTGRDGYRTPAGRYVITDKHRSHVSTLYHVAMPWFMRLNCGAIGLHSGYVTGRPASHGCIRLPYEKAREFFQQVAVGDEVEIVY